MAKPISERIIEYRKAKGLTQERLGSMLNVSGQAVSKWEKGESMPDIMVLPDLCKIFGISMDTLFDMPILEQNEYTLKNTALFADKHGRNETLHELTSLLYDNGGNKIQGTAVNFSNTSMRIYDERGMCFVITDKDYLELCRGFDTDDVSDILKFLSDGRTLDFLRHIKFETAITKNELEGLTGCGSAALNDILLKMMELDFICKGYDNEGKHGYMVSERMFAVYMILSGLVFLRKDGDVGMMWFSRQL